MNQAAASISLVEASVKETHGLSASVPHATINASHSDHQPGAIDLLMA
jgi:hypothetical protein